MNVDQIEGILGYDPATEQPIELFIRSFFHPTEGEYDMVVVLFQRGNRGKIAGRLRRPDNTIAFVFGGNAKKETVWEAYEEAAQRYKGLKESKGPPGATLIPSQLTAVDLHNTHSPTEVLHRLEEAQVIEYGEALGPGTWPLSPDQQPH